MSQHPCRIYLVTPPRFDLANFAETLKPILDEVDCASLLLDIDDSEADLVEEAASELMGLAFNHDIAFLIANAPELALKLGADGVHITTGVEDLKAARQILGSERLVGAGRISNRHDAMVVAEAGADYVAFGGQQDFALDIDKACEMTQWWAEIFEIPSVAFCTSSPDEATKLVAAGADFLGLRDTIWNSSQDPLAAAKDYMRKIESKTVA